MSGRYYGYVPDYDHGPILGTADCAASMVGQRVHLTIGGDWARPLGRAVIAAAQPAPDGVSVFLTLDVDASSRDHVAALWGPPHETGDDRITMGMGFRVIEVVDDPTAERKSATRVRVYEINRAPTQETPDPAREDRILGGVLRQFLAEHEPYARLAYDTLTLDGHVRLDPEQITAVRRAMDPTRSEIT